MGYGAFARACCHHRGVHDAGEGEALTEAGDDFVFHEVFHLVGHARHGDEDHAIALEPHTLGGAALVGQQGASFGDHGLRAVHFDHGFSSLGKDGLHALPEGFVEFEFGVEIVYEGFLRDVVFGGAEATGHQDDLRLDGCAVEALHDVVGIVAATNHFVGLNAEQTELLANPCAVRVDGLTN